MPRHGVTDVLSCSTSWELNEASYNKSGCPRSTPAQKHILFHDKEKLEWLHIQEYAAIMQDLCSFLLCQAHVEKENDPNTTLTHWWLLMAAVMLSQCKFSNWMLTDYNHWVYDGNRSCVALFDDGFEILSVYGKKDSRAIIRPFSHFHHFIWKALKYTTFQLSKQRPWAWATHFSLWRCVCVYVLCIWVCHEKLQV